MRFAMWIALFAWLGAAPWAASPATAHGAEPVLADTLRGRVTDAEGAPVDGVQVLVSEIGRAVPTDPDGRYVVPGLRAGRYTVVFRRLGYSTVVREVRVEGDTDLSVALRESPVHLPGLVVTATRFPTGVGASPLPTSALDGEALRRGRQAGLAATLEQVPGVRNFSTGAQVGKPVIRGVTGTRVLVMDDGMRLESHNWGDEHGPNADPLLAQRIEVVRGPASVLYGSDALGGVVNVIPPDLPDAIGRPAFARGAFSATAGSNNEELGGAFRLEGAAGRVGFTGTLVGRRAGDYRTPAGRLENSGFKSWSGSVAFGLREPWGDLAVRYNNFTADYEVVEGEEEEEEEEPFLAFRDHRVQATGRFWVGAGQVETRFQWQRNWLREFEVPDEAEVDLRMSTYSGDVLYRHERTDRLRGAVGASGFIQTNATRGDEPLVTDARVAALGVFAFEEISLHPRWTASVGMRGDVRRLEAEENAELGVEEQTRNFSALTGNAGILYRPVEVIGLAANVARGWRAPNFFELFANGEHKGTARFEIGNPSIGPETSLNVDLALRWNHPVVRGEISVFRNDIRDFIFIEPTGDIDPESGLRVFRYRSSNALLRGVEGHAEVHPLHELVLRGAFDWVRGEETRTNEPLPLIPPARLGLGVEWHQDVHAPWGERAYVSFDTEAITRQKRLSEFDIPTAPYTLYHAGAGITFQVGRRSLSADVQVRNLTDKAFRAFLSRYKEFALDQGRTVIVRLTTGF